MRWIDTVMFNGEPIIKARLEILKDHVDLFYITEQRYTHQGQRKEQLYIEKHMDWFIPYLNKIRFLVDDKEYNRETNSWSIENEQRNFPLEYIATENKGHQYICSVCDCDEIPNPEAVKRHTPLYDQCFWGCVIMIQEF
jgi:hypothetical protein